MLISGSRHPPARATPPFLLLLMECSQQFDLRCSCHVHWYMACQHREWRSTDVSPAMLSCSGVLDQPRVGMLRCVGSSGLVLRGASHLNCA
jgi:hypothetical protein